MCTIMVILLSAVRLAAWRPIILAAVLVMCKFGPVVFLNRQHVEEVGGTVQQDGLDDTLTAGVKHCNADKTMNICPMANFHSEDVRFLLPVCVRMSISTESSTSCEPQYSVQKGSAKVMS